MTYLKNVIRSTIKNISNIPGWSTDRKLVVFEVDDWGAIRTRSKEARENMIASGINLRKSRFNYYDSLAGKNDLEPLFETLLAHKDQHGRPAVFTAVSVVANPDFDKIRQSDFRDYYYESLGTTLNRYFEGENILDIWKQGIDSGVFHPEYHGREHLNTNLWLGALQSGDKGLMTAFNNESVGVLSKSLKDYKGGYLSAFDFKDKNGLQNLKAVIEDGLDIFQQLFGYRARHFTSSGMLHHHVIHAQLKKGGIDYVDVAKRHLEPQGGGAYKTMNYRLGQHNDQGQTYITRNVRFEPADKQGFEWVDSAMNDIEIAFRWKKPAIISSHRVNYVGQIDPGNREKGLKQLKTLLTRLLQRWPAVEFMTVAELGEEMNKKNVS